MPKTREKLTLKQAAFVREYLVDLDAANAARRAGYSTRTAKQIAHEMLKHPGVQKMLAEEMAKRAAKVEDSAEAVLREIIETGRQARAAGKFDAAMRALELRGRHQGMFRDNLVLSGSLMQELAALNARAH